MCVCVCVYVWKQKRVCVCARARVCALSVFVCSVCEGFNCGFSLLFSICFFFGALVKRLLLLLASNFALSVPALPFANPIHEREFIGQGR
uniref:Uncharacterized protein n=1 Tax=Canis lupus familiaris TaxID=9615 RepID=A0A8P0PH83_CANLF